MFQNERDRKKIAIEIQETTDVCWATEDREHVIMKEIVELSFRERMNCMWKQELDFLEQSQ